MLREHRDKAQGVPDLLNHALMAKEGVMLLKDGAFCAGWSYYGPDLNSSSFTEMESLSASVNQTLCQLGDGWMIHADLIRSPSADYPLPERCAFTDPTSRLMDEERRQQYLAEGAHFESQYVLVVTYKPPTELESRFKKLFLQGGQQQKAGWEKILSLFEHKIDQLENSLSKLLILKRLDSQGLLTHIHRCITGLNTTLHVPKIPVYLDTLLGTQDLIGGMYPKIGNHHMRLIGLAGFPLESQPGLLTVLEHCPLAYRWSNRFILLEPQTAVQALKVYRRNWFQKRQGLKGLLREALSPHSSTGFVNRDALAMAEDADAAIEEAESGLVRYGYYTSVIVLMGENLTEIDEAAKHILKTLELKGFQGRLETINAMEAYLGTIPGHGYQNIRRPLIHSLNFADILPLTSVWPGLKANPCRYYPPQSPALLYAATTGATPFRFHLHVADVAHTLIIGDTGAGKSTLLGLMIAQFFRYPNAQVYLFDKGYSAYVLCKAMQGAHYDIAGIKETPAFYPLAHLEAPYDFDKACEWVEILLECQKITVTTAHRKEIRQSLARLRAQTSRTLTDFQGTIQHEEIKQALDFYTLSGGMGDVLDAKQDSFCQARFHVFEMMHLMSKGEACVIPTIAYLFQQIKKRLTGAPTLIFIEEGHTFLTGKFGEELDVAIREFRKSNAGIVFLTQSLAEITQSSLKHSLLNNCKTKIFLPNREADSEINAPLYQSAGLTHRQLEILKQAQPKQHYYYASPLGKRLIDLGLGKVALSFVGVDSQADRTLADTLEREYGPLWVYHWLKQRELPNWANYWLSLQQQYQQQAVNEQAELSYATL